MQKTQVTFSLILIINVRILDIPKFLRNVKGYFIPQTSEERGEIRRKKLKHKLTDYLYVHRSSFHHRRHEKKMKHKCLNEMKCYVNTVLHLILLLKKKNIIPTKTPNIKYLKNLILKKLFSNRKESM